MNLLMIAGFLGSGKTTLILSLAKHLVETGGQKIAVLVNEYGEIGIDDKVLGLAGPRSNVQGPGPRGTGKGKREDGKT